MAGSVNGLADPHLQAGGDFHIVDLGNGNIMALCPACYSAAKASILADAEGAMNGDGAVNWNSVNWNSVNWNSVNWNSVNWNSVNWNSVNWNSVNWNS
jgi:hypothetical protein